MLRCLACRIGLVPRREEVQRAAPLPFSDHFSSLRLRFTFTIVYLFLCNFDFPVGRICTMGICPIDCFPIEERQLLYDSVLRSIVSTRSLLFVRQPAEFVDCFDYLRKAVFRHRFAYLHTIEPENLPSQRCQGVVALVVFGDTLRDCVPCIPVRFDIQFAIGTEERKIESVVLFVRKDVILSLGSYPQSPQRIPQRIFERAVVIEVVDFFRGHQFAMPGGDEDDPTLAQTDDRIGKRLDTLEKALEILFARFHIVQLVGEKRFTSNPKDICDTRKITNGIGFVAKNLRLIESQPLWREASRRAEDGNPIPQLVADAPPVRLVVDDRDEYGSTL